MKLSIITINLNESKGLRKTIQSVVRQSFTDYELIIIDGQSTDDSMDIVKEYEDKISYWISEKDSGIYNAMNKGIKQAKGDYCYFLNSGDYLASNEVLSKMFEGNPQESFICGNFTTEARGHLTHESPYRNRDWTFSLYDIYSGDLCHQAFFIKRDNFTKYEMYNETLRITSDWRLFFIAIGINHETVAYRDVDMVVYNMEGLSSQIGGKAIYEERKRTTAEVLDKSVAARLDRLYYLEKNSYVTDIVMSRKWLFTLFRAFCKVWRTLGFIK